MEFSTLIKVLIISLCLCSVTSRIDTNKDKVQNVTESSPTLSPEEDYEFVEEDTYHSKSFVEKLRELHNKNGNKTVTYSAKHINETFEAIDNFRENFKYLFKTDDRLAKELLGFVTELDIQLSSACSSALIRIYNAVKETEIWALRCE